MIMIQIVCFINRSNSIRNMWGLVIRKIKAIPDIETHEFFHTKKGSMKLIHSYIRHHMKGLVIRTNHGQSGSGWQNPTVLPMTTKYWLLFTYVLLTWPYIIVSELKNLFIAKSTSKPWLGIGICPLAEKALRTKLISLKIDFPFLNSKKGFKGH